MSSAALLPSRVTTKNRIARLVWTICWTLLYRPTPNFCHGWRRFLLRLFGAKIAAGAHPYPTAKIWAPWNLVMEANSGMGPFVDCYCVAPVVLGENCTVSQYSYLCTASHDFRSPDFALVCAPIRIGKHAWVAADVFVGPGVTIGDGAVVGARSSVFKNIPAQAVAVGNPARPLHMRK